MKSLLELIKLLYGPKAISSTLGTRTNVIRLPSGKLQRYLKEDLNIEMVSDNAALNAYNEMRELIPDIAKMNDSERLIFEGNLRRLKNKLEASGLIPKPKVEGEVIGMESKEKITGENLKKLTEEKGTVNPPTTVAGQLEQSAKKLEGLGKNLEQEFVKGKKRSVSELLDDYFSSYSTMKQIEDQGLVRAVARQIMYNDLKTGKLKVPKEVEETIRGMTSKDVLDDFSQWYGFDAVENLYDNADKFYKMSSPQEAIKFLKENKYSNWEKVFQPREKPIKEYMEPEEFRNMLSKLAYNRKGVFVEPGSEKLDAKTLDEIKTYYSKEKPEVVVNEIKRIEEGQIFNEFPEEDKKTILQTLLDLIKKGSPTAAGGVGLEYLARKATPQTEGGTQQSLGLDYLTGMVPSEGYANGGRISFSTGGGKKILDLIAEINKKLKGKKSMETVNPKTGEVTTPKEPVKTAESKSTYKPGDPITEENFGSSPFAPSQKTLDNLKKAREMTRGMSLEEEMNMILNQYDKSMFIKNEQGVVDVTNPQNIQKMALLLKRDHPELYRRLEAQTTMTPTIEEFKQTNPKAYDDFSKSTNRMQELLNFRSGQEIFETFDLETYNYLNSKQIERLLNQLKNPYKILDKERNVVRSGFTSKNFEGTGLKNLDEINFRVDKKQLETYLDDLYNKKQIEEAQIELSNLQDSGREPNANGGRVGFSNGTEDAPSITLDTHDKAPANMDKYPIKAGNLELGIIGAMRSGKSTPDPYVKINTADRDFTVRGKYNVPNTGISLLGDIGDIRSKSKVNIDDPRYNYKETIKDVMKLNPYSVGIEYAPDQNRNINLRYDNQGNVMLRGEARFAKGGLGYLVGE